MKKIYNELLNTIKKENIFLNEDMKKHTSFKTGGKTDFFIKAYSIQDVQDILRICKENNIPMFVLGNGTNVLVKDEGFKGIVLQIKLDNIIIKNNEVIVDAGVKNAVLANKLLNNSLSGFEFASGIPGTIGGAVKMNAGAYGNEMKDIISEVKYIDYDGNVKIIKNEECEFKYRGSIFSRIKGVILQTKLNLYSGNRNEIESKMLELSKIRKEKQPLEYPNAGSTFKRGEGYITAKLIDECGLKGYTIGGAQVSEKHAGFVINKNKATTTDVLKLIEYIKEKVKNKTGISIDTEIEII